MIRLDDDGFDGLRCLYEKVAPSPGANLKTERASSVSQFQYARETRGESTVTLAAPAVSLPLVEPKPPPSPSPVPAPLELPLAEATPLVPPVLPLALDAASPGSLEARPEAPAARSRLGLFVVAALIVVAVGGGTIALLKGAGAEPTTPIAPAAEPSTAAPVTPATTSEGPSSIESALAMAGVAGPSGEGLRPDETFPGAFEAGDVGPRISSEAALASLVERAKRCTGRLVVTGHTCNLGTESENRVLGMRRAEEVVRILVKGGISESRIVADSAGQSEPVSSNDDEAGRVKNRRVVVECRAE